DVVDADRELGPIGDASENLTEQHEHCHGHRDREHEQLRNPGTGDELTTHQRSQLVQPVRRLQGDGDSRGVHAKTPRSERWKNTSSRLGEVTSRSRTSGPPTATSRATSVAADAGADPRRLARARTPPAR